jgi:N6-L-threonylcarbamoyladenine synthase
LLHLAGGAPALQYGVTIFALETSCDETAVAILRDDGGQLGSQLLASEVASQVAEHEKYGGVVPEVASRNHLVHAPRLVERAVRDARIDMSEVDAFAATSGPGLASSLMIGASIAKGLALGFGKPYLAINHLEGHLLSPFFGNKTDIEPNVALIVSGGHTLLVEVLALNRYRVLGRTLDDAAGEAFDKVAKLLGLGYPGGPEIERRAQRGDPARFDLPRSMLDSRDHNFSFSGLKTAVRYLLPKIGVIPSRGDGDGSLKRSSDTRPTARSFGPSRTGVPARDDDVIADVCASFQRAVTDVLVNKTIRATRECQHKVVTVSGGVSCNRELRDRVRAACDDAGFKLLAADSPLCTDNAAMIAFVASRKFRAGMTTSVTDEIDPNLALTKV